MRLCLALFTFFLAFGIVHTQNLSVPLDVNLTSESQFVFDQTALDESVGNPKGIAVAAGYGGTVIAVPDNGAAESSVRVFYTSNTSSFTMNTTVGTTTGGIIGAVSLVYAERLDTYVLVYGVYESSTYTMHYASAPGSNLTTWTVGGIIESSTSEQTVAVSTLAVQFVASAGIHYWALGYTLDATMVVIFVNTSGFTLPDFSSAGDTALVLDLEVECGLTVDTSTHAFKDIALQFFPGAGSSVPLAFAWIEGELGNITAGLNNYRILPDILNISGVADCMANIITVASDIQGTPYGQDNIGLVYTDTEGPVVFYQDASDPAILAHFLTNNTDDEYLVDAKSSGFYLGFQVVSNGEDVLIIYTHMTDDLNTPSGYSNFSIYYRTSTDLQTFTNETQISYDATITAAAEADAMYQGRLGLSLGPEGYVGVVLDWTDDSYATLQASVFVGSLDCVVQGTTVIYKTKMKCLSSTEMYMVGDWSLADFRNTTVATIEDIYTIHVPGEFVADDDTIFEARFTNYATFKAFQDASAYTLNAESLELRGEFSVVLVNPSISGTETLTYYHASAETPIDSEWQTLILLIENGQSTREVYRREYSNMLGSAQEERQDKRQVPCGSPQPTYDNLTITMQLIVAPNEESCPTSGDGDGDGDDEDERLGLGLGLGLGLPLLLLLILCCICILILIVLFIVVIIVVVVLLAMGTQSTSFGALIDRVRGDGEKDDKKGTEMEPAGATAVGAAAAAGDDESSITTSADERSGSDSYSDSEQGDRSQSQHSETGSYSGSRSYSGSDSRSLSRTDSRSYSRSDGSYSRSGDSYSRSGDSYTGSDSRSYSRSETGDSYGSQDRSYTDSRTGDSAPAGSGSAGSYTGSEGSPRSDGSRSVTGSGSERSQSGSFFSGTSSGTVSGTSLTGSEASEEGSL